ncbi:DUF4276 family protein [Xanthomonas sontii]|uniref:DUF4276 family protein n=1 Tax=Xanthomonas sontii TaxID=2650745 RepID=A0A6N7QGE8_9XANT|nr:DUF4276 family protein [Xanthomonas sontii]MRH01906.1 DUF4276 family protein [Xanthomonas sontii]MRH76238.1 DUF4276 family protein [Xanthomonas sontii]
MNAAHYELLVEEPSMENFLHSCLPRLLANRATYAVHPFQGKDDLMKKLEGRLRGYAAFMPKDWRIVILVDRDDDDCRQLKTSLERMCSKAGLKSRAVSKHQWQVATRIAIEELEAWYFGDWQAVKAAFPRVAATVDKQQTYRNPDAVRGGTWEAFERVMQRYGYFNEGLPKLSAARSIGAHIDPTRSVSPSFKAFCQAISCATN